mmetsp:Transcript_29202/g.52861  ORF Transcript_29202/g.52861 Transcript_29202/m.52861 type:complete len:248 (+) Transcript_29202:411-1154(+)
MENTPSRSFVSRKIRCTKASGAPPNLALNAAGKVLLASLIHSSPGGGSPWRPPLICMSVILRRDSMASKTRVPFASECLGSDTPTEYKEVGTRNAFEVPITFASCGSTRITLNTSCELRTDESTTPTVVVNAAAPSLSLSTRRALRSSVLCRYRSCPPSKECSSRRLMSASGTVSEVCLSTLETMNVIHDSGTVLNPRSTKSSLIKLAQSKSPLPVSSSTKKVGYHCSPSMLLLSGGLNGWLRSTHR